MIGVEKEERPHDGKINHTRKETENKLDQLFKDLEEQWDSIKLSKPSRYSTDSSSIICETTFQLMDNSPRSIMSSLQQRWSPDESAWKVRNNDLVVMEILRERRAAIESGKLKGRRLFQEPESESLRSGWSNGLNQESEVRSVCSYDSDHEEEEGIGGSHEEEEVLPVYSERCDSYSSSNNSSLPCEIAERQVKEEEKLLVVAQVEEKTSVGGEKWMCTTGLRWIVVLIVFAVLGTISMRSFFENKDEDEVILVPT